MLAFRTFGYGIILNNPGIKLVREQILNPEKEVIQRPYWINYHFGDEFNGVNIVKEPKELRCFIVVFNLKTNGKPKKFAIALPGHSPESKEIYKNINDILCTGDGKTMLSLEIENIDSDTYIKREQAALASYIFWKEYCIA